MLKNKFPAEFQGKRQKAKGISRVKLFTFYFLLFSFVAVATGCRYDMQDQPRYKVYKSTDWFPDGRASREAPEGTVARGFLRDNKALYTGKLETSTGTAQTNEAGQQITFPDSVTEFPMAVTQEVLDRGEERYKIYCSVCHGNFGGGDGMAVRRGFTKPPSYNDDRLRNAPVGHFYDVATNGWGKMNGYAAQISVSDRWAIVAYIRALQLSQNPNPTAKTPATGANTAPAANAAPTATAPTANANSNVRTTTPTNTNTAGGNQR
jgi:mono/diheme cytochrome c family protein